MADKWQLTMWVALAGILGGAVDGAPVAERKARLQIEGSTTVGPIADAFAEAFMKAHKGAAITVKKTGSGDGAAAPSPLPVFLIVMLTSLWVFMNASAKASAIGPTVVEPSI